MVLNQVGIDGIFGPDTEKTVEAFQRDKGLQVDGIVGPITWGAICNSLNASVPSSYFEDKPRVTFVGTETQQESSQPILPESAMPTSEDPTADPNEELGIQGDEGSGTESDEGTDQATLQSIVESLNDTQKALLVSNATSETQLSANLSNLFENATQAVREANATISQEQLPTNETISAENVTQAVGQVCADGSLPDVNSLCPHGNPPPSSLAGNMTQAPVAGNETGQVCADGSLPDVNSLCPHGNPPPSSLAGNMTQSSCCRQRNRSGLC